MGRKFTSYTNENGGVVQAHTVTKDTEGSVLTLDGTGRDVREGDVLIATPNPNVFVVGDDSLLENYTADTDDDSDTEDESVVIPTLASDDDDDSVTDATRDPEFDPSEKDAAAVRRYLESAKARGDRVEFNRVVTLEQNDKNRRTALVDYDR